MKNLDAAEHYFILYSIILILSCAFGTFKGMENKKKKGWYLFLTFLVFAVIMGFRTADMGNDTRTYAVIFRKIAMAKSPVTYIENSDIEPGYILYNWILSKIFNAPGIVFLVSAIFVCTAIGIFTYKHVKAPGIFCCLFVGIMQFDFFLSTVRQGIAIAIGLFAFDFLLKRKPIPFILLCGLAATFHNSAVAFFLAYPCENRMKKNTLYGFLLMAIFICGFFFDSILGGLLRFFPKYNYYVGGDLLDGEPRLAILLKVVVFALLFFVPKILKGWKTEKTPLANAGNVMALLNLAALIIAANATALARLGALFGVYTTMQYSNEILEIRKEDRTTMIILTLVAFFAYGITLVILKTPEWQTTYPINLEFIEF